MVTRMQRALRANALGAAAWTAGLAAAVLGAFLALSLVAGWQSWRYLHALDGVTLASATGRARITDLHMSTGVLSLRAHLHVKVCGALGCDPPLILELRVRNNPWLPVDERLDVVQARGRAAWRTLVDLQATAPGLFNLQGRSR